MDTTKLKHIALLVTGAAMFTFTVLVPVLAPYLGVLGTKLVAASGGALLLLGDLKKVLA